MIFRKITIENFKSYRGFHEIEFATEKNKNITLFTGENNHGKSVLLEAVKWCLYDEFPPKERMPFGNKDLFYEDKKVMVSVNLQIKHQDQIYVIQRKTDIYNQRDLDRPKSKLYVSGVKKDGTPTKEYDKLLKKLYKCGKVIMYRNYNLTHGCKKVYLDDKTFDNMTDVLDEHRPIWDKCSYFIIEKQMAFRGKVNVMALKLGQHCYSYFRIMYRDFKPIIDYPAYHKTNLLGAKKIDVKQKPKRKKWAIQKAKDILEFRKDTDNFEALCKEKKKDDIADCILMNITFCILKLIK